MVKIAKTTKITPVPNMRSGSAGAGPGTYVIDAIISTRPRIRSTTEPNLTRVMQPQLCQGTIPYEIYLLFGCLNYRFS